MFNPAGTFAYVANKALNNVSLCPLNPDGSFGTCTFTGSMLAAPNSIVLNSTGTYALLTNESGSDVTLSKVNSNGTLTGQVRQDSVLFVAPFQIALNFTNTRVYVADAISGVVSCKVSTTGIMSDCIIASATPSTGIALTK